MRDVVDLVITVLDGTDGADSLRDWLRDDDGLRGKVRVSEPPMEPGQLGPPVDVLGLVLEKGGALTVAAHCVLLWLRSRRGRVTIEIVRGRRRAKVTADRVRGVDAEQLSTLAQEVAHTLDGE